MREKTDSITHLVKIVANEEIDKRIDEIKKSYIDERIVISGEAFLSNIRSSLENARNIWSKEEDELLLQEIRTAVAQIAVNHSRSQIAIRSRISSRHLWE